MNAFERPESPPSWTRHLIEPGPAERSDEPMLGYECALPFLLRTPLADGDSATSWPAAVAG